MSIHSFVQPGKASIIVGGQFGSEAKGLAAAVVAQEASHLKRGLGPHIATTNAGAQAGHTTILADGTKFVCYHLPTVGVLIRHSTIYLNAGSIIDPDLLMREIESIANVTGEPIGELMSRIVIHPNAAVIQPADKMMENSAGGTGHLGSTQKGVGSALAGKIMRRPNGIAREALAAMDMLKRGVTIGELNMNEKLNANFSVTVEIPQGTDLSLNASSFYPKCTSRDCWVGQGMADAGINPYYLGHVMMVQRTFPIRVGHIYDGFGQIVGNSGPFYSDSEELRWETDFPGVEPERTTVTKRVRRIASWSQQQYRHALWLNRPTIVMTTFVNYLKDADDFENMRRSMRNVHAELSIPIHCLWSWGPRTDQWSRHVETVLDGTWRVDAGIPK